MLVLFGKLKIEFVAPFPQRTVEVRRHFNIKKLWASVAIPLPPHTQYPRKYHNQQLVQSDDTFALSGNENYIVDDSGYYRIEAVAEFSNDFKMEDGRLGAVIGVVSKNDNSND